MENTSLATIPTPAPEAERKVRVDWSADPKSEYVIHRVLHDDSEHQKKWRCEECRVFVCCYWHECHLPFSERTLSRLICDYDRLHRKIDANGSAQLDLETDRQQEVVSEITRRLGLLAALETRDARIARLQDSIVHLLEQKKDVSSFLGWLPVQMVRLFPKYIYIASPRRWLDQFGRGLIRPLIRGERPRAFWGDGFLPYLFRNNRASRSVHGARQVGALEPFEVGGARPIPGKKYNAAGGRWGGGILGLIEVGSRDPDDPLGLRVQDALMLLREWVRR